MKAGAVPAADPLALAAALIAASMVAVYVTVMQGQDDRPLLWVLVLLLAAGPALALLGLLAILSIGLPILVAGGLALLAGARRP